MIAVISSVERSPSARMKGVRLGGRVGPDLILLSFDTDWLLLHFYFAFLYHLLLVFL